MLYYLQGNRVKKSSCDEACEIVVVPCGGFASQAHGILTRSPSRQIVGHVFYRREVGWRILGSHAAFVVAEDHVHDPMQAVLDGPMAADHWRDRQREQHQRGDVKVRLQGESWPHKSAQNDKLIFCLTAASMIAGNQEHR